MTQRVEVTYAIPNSGFEFDPRDHLGGSRRFDITIVVSGQTVRVSRYMAVVGWSVLQEGPGVEARAVVTFEERVEEA